jgi:hypothetical protein
VVVSDCLRDFIEPELLVPGIISPSLKNNISSTKHFNNSVEWQLRYHVEWSINVDTELIIESLGLSLLSLIKIKNLPFLVCSAVVSSNTNSIAFFILRSSYVKDLVIGPVDELIIIVLEDLEPSWVGAPDLHVVGSTWALDVEWLVVQSCLDSQWSLIEIPNLSSSSVLNLDDHISIVDEVKVSSTW